MKVTIESTTKIVRLNGVEARIWEGQTDGGIRVHAYVTRVAVAAEEAPSVFRQFEAELRECRPPSAEVRFIPFDLIL